TTLYTFAQTLPEKTGWWKHLRTSTDPDLSRARETLGELLIARRTEAPTRLLQLGDRLTGYTAVIANLPGADRRLADWQGFGELVRSLEAGSFDVLAVIRRLQRLQTAEVEVPRPALAGGNAVSLMTIHGSKGLEWPVVIVPDLTRQSPPDSPLVRFDPDLGVALKLEDEDGERQKTALYTLLEQRKKAADSEESKRVLYVALTRARDRLILTAAKSAGGGLDILQPGLEGLIAPASIPFAPDMAQPVAPVAPAKPALPEQIMLYPARAGFAELPVTALSDYAICPLRFKFRYVDGHPGYHEDDGLGVPAKEIGKLTHKALELGIRDLDTLSKHRGNLKKEHVIDALACAERFHQAEAFAPYRQGGLARECPVSLPVGNLTLNGMVDLVGEDFVLDFKTDQTMYPEHHQFQLWAYSRATGKPSAYLAYLRHDHLHSFDVEALQAIDQKADALVEGMISGNFAPQSALHTCGICPYGEACDARQS
ncbi:MAG: 3'-5' exonuclease, partial [Nodosilinea sp.]